MVNTNKKLFGVAIIFLMILMSISMVSAVKPITSIQTTEGYSVVPVVKDFIRTGEMHEFELHIVNISNGMPITTGLGCYMHLYHKIGNHAYEGYDDTVNHDFDYAFNVDGGNFTSRGIYHAKFNCNDSTYGGIDEIEFGVNDYGEELTPAITQSHNQSMWFLMILFGISLIGVVAIKNPLGKVASYFSAHIIFIAGTFSEWQFLQGYAMSYIANAGIFKVLFYVSTIALFPAIIMLVAGTIIFYATQKKIMNLMDHGMSEAEAYNRQGRKFK